MARSAQNLKWVALGLTGILQMIVGLHLVREGYGCYPKKSSPLVNAGSLLDFIEFFTLPACLQILAITQIFWTHKVSNFTATRVHKSIAQDKHVELKENFQLAVRQLL